MDSSYKKLKHYNALGMEQHLLRQILLPSWRQLLVYTLVSLFFTAIAAQSIITSVITRLAHIDEGLFRLVARQGISNFLRQLENITGIDLLVITAFWSIVGLVVYLAAISLLNTLISAHNEVVVLTEYTNRGSFSSELKRDGLHMVWIILAVALVAFTIWAGMALWLTLFSGFLTALPTASTSSFGFLAASVLVLIITVHIVWILLRLLFTQI